MTTDNLARVEAVCTDLHNQGQPVTFTAVADRTGISRTTLYRNHTLRTAVEAVADRVREHEERIRRLEPTPRRKTN